MNDNQYRTIVGHTHRQYQQHTLVSRLMTFDRLLFVGIVLTMLGGFTFGYFTAVHHFFTILDQKLTSLTVRG
jgi:hypothetical protein